LQLELGGKFHLKLNISGRPIANKYREGKMKRTLKRESNSTWNCWNVIEEAECDRKFFRGFFLFIVGQNGFYNTLFMGEGFSGVVNSQCFIFNFNLPCVKKWGTFSVKENSDSDKIFFFIPSWNTDQGVYHTCKCLRKIFSWIFLRIFFIWNPRTRNESVQKLEGFFFCLHKTTCTIHRPWPLYGI